MKNLASIEKIILLEPLKNGSKDFEKATLSNSHQVIFRKGLFKLGDLCVFFKENSKLPDIKVFSSLGLNNLIVTKEIIEGELSEGICSPLNILPKDLKIELGKDVSKALNVKFLDVYLEKQIEKTLLERKLAKRKAIAKGLINKIKKAFSNITLGNGISLREARRIDDDWVDRCQTAHALDEVENWQKVTDADLKEYADGLHCFSDEKGKMFYLPAYMCFGLREFIRTSQSPYVSSGLYTVPPLGEDEFLGGWLNKDKILCLNQEQTLIVKHYIALVAELSEGSTIGYFLLNIYSAKEFINDLEQYLVKDKDILKRESKFINKPQIRRHGKKKKVF